MENVGDLGLDILIYSRKGKCIFSLWSNQSQYKWEQFSLQASLLVLFNPCLLVIRFNPGLLLYLEIQKELNLHPHWILMLPDSMVFPDSFASGFRYNSHKGQGLCYHLFALEPPMMFYFALWIITQMFILWFRLI